MKSVMDAKIKIGISSCLLGEHVRYDGGHKQDHYLTDTLGEYVEWIPVCPEVEYGLPVPREAMRLVGDTENPRLVTRTSGVDHTAGMNNWAKKRLKKLESENFCGFIFKSRSPSSGMKGVKIYTASGMPGRTGTGLFARAFMQHFPCIPVEDDGRLRDPGIRENFIERIFVYMRWINLLKNSPSVKKLIKFHSEHKYLIMAHSPKHLKELGQLVAGCKKLGRACFNKYFEIMMAGLVLNATVKKNVNVLHHILGYFRKLLSADEKQEMLEIIGQYKNGYVPLIVPVTLFNHFVRKYNEPYLESQYYLHPHPVNLKLRNHA